MRRILVVVSWIGLSVVLAAPVGAQGEPTVSISPPTLLEDGDLVDIDGNGFEPGTTVFVLLCNDDVRLGDELGRCSVIGDGARGYEIDNSGRLDAPEVPVPFGRVGAASLATCPPSASQLARGVSCSVNVVAADLAGVASIDVTYDSAPQPGAGNLAFTGFDGIQLIWMGVTLFLVGMLASGGGQLWGRHYGGRGVVSDVGWVDALVPLPVRAGTHDRHPSGMRAKVRPASDSIDDVSRWQRARVSPAVKHSRWARKSGG